MTDAINPLTDLSASLAALVAAAAPSLVSVRSRGARSSGFVWRPGLVLTADEALAEEGEVSVTLTGADAPVAAQVAGRDPSTDVALLRLDTGDAPAAAFGGDRPSVGALAVAVGARDGGASAALGVVAASGGAWRSMRGGDIDARIELDLRLARDAQGGLALDAGGRALGMAVSGPRRSVLVIPGATVARVAALLERDGRVARGYLGLGLQAVRLPGGDAGAVVMGVDPDGPGARAGVMQGDVVRLVDGRPLGSVANLVRSLGPVSVGRVLRLDLTRGGEPAAASLEVAGRR